MLSIFNDNDNDNDNENDNALFKYQLNLVPPSISRNISLPFFCHDKLPPIAVNIKKINIK